MDRKCTALVGDALRLMAALSRSKDETEIRAAENPRPLELADEAE